MKKVILLSIMFIYSCNDNSESLNDLYLKVQGDWLYHNSEKWRDSFFLSIMDSLIFYGEHIDSFDTFYMSVDTNKYKFSLNFNIESNFKLRFSRITSKYLWTFEDKSYKEIPKFVSTNVFHNEMITLRGLEVRFIDDYRRLLDWGIYFDEDYNFFIRIESTKTSPYIKNPFSLPVGTYKCKFDKSDFEFLQNKLRNVPFNLLKNSYSSEHFEYDVAIMFLDIHYSYANNTDVKTIHIKSTGLEGIPSYLGVFVNYVHKFYNFMDLPTDTTSFNNFEFYSQDFINSNRNIFFPFKPFKPDKSP